MAKNSIPKGAQEMNTRPKYRVLQKCYIDDTMHDPDSRPIDEETGDHKPLYIVFDGPPGPHLEPVNPAAEAQCEKYKHLMQEINPINDMTQMK